jgi:hypothetical protein
MLECGLSTDLNQPNILGHAMGRGTITHARKGAIQREEELKGRGEQVEPGRPEFALLDDLLLPYSLCYGEGERWMDWVGGNEWDWAALSLTQQGLPLLGRHTPSPRAPHLVQMAPVQFTKST